MTKSHTASTLFEHSFSLSPSLRGLFVDKTVAPLVGSLAKIANETQMKKDLGNMLG